MRRGTVPALLVLGPLLFGAPQPAVAQGGPCADPIIDRGFVRAAQGNAPVLYDGVSPLRRPPTTPVSFSATDGCVLLSVMLIERDGQFVLESAGTVAVSGPRNNRARVVPPMVTTATQILRDILNQGVFPQAPSESGRYTVAIPLWSAHPLYQTRAAATSGTADASGAPATLADRGWPDAELLSAREGLAIYRLAARGEFLWLAAVRDIGINEPIVDLQNAEGRFGPVQRYGPETRRRFLEDIAPLVPLSAQRAQTVQVWTYATGVHAQRPEPSSFVFAQARHPITGSDQVEMPVSIESWQGIRRSPSEPFAWDDMIKTGVQGAAHNTIAVIQGLYERDAARAAVAQAATAERDAREAAARRTRESERVAFEVRKARAYQGAGLIYLEPSYWERLRMGSELRAVFEGDFPNATREWEFGRIYRFVIGNFSARCRRLIPPGSPRVVTTEIETRNGDARITDQDTVFVPEAFAQPYRWWDEDSPLALADLPPGMTELPNPLEGVSGLSRGLEATGQLARVSASLRSDMDEVFGDGCEGPVLEQLMENMRRLALSQPSLQASRIPVVFPDPARPTIALSQACEQYIDEGGFIVDSEWCPCLENVFRERTTVGERWGYIREYTQFFRKVDTPPDGGPTDPDWAFYEPANACRRE